MFAAKDVTVPQLPAWYTSNRPIFPPEVFANRGTDHGSIISLSKSAFHSQVLIVCFLIYKYSFSIKTQSSHFAISCFLLSLRFSLSHLKGVGRPPLAGWDPGIQTSDVNVRRTSKHIPLSSDLIHYIPL